MRIAGFGWRHASAVAVFTAVLATVPAVTLWPDRPTRQPEPITLAQPAEASAPPPPGPAAEPTAVPVEAPRDRVRPGAAPKQATIPEEAFLQPPDTGAERHERLPWYSHALPELCGTAFRSVAAIALGGHVVANYHPRRAEGYIPDDTLLETVAVYRAGGAARFMRELRDAVHACPVNRYEEVQCHTGEVGTYALARTPDHGDDAVVVRFTYPEMRNDGPTGRRDSRLDLAVRIGDVVMVLAQQGYEFAHVDPATFHEIGRRAVQRLAAWQPTVRR
jgi:hypothetical protein